MACDSSIIRPIDSFIKYFGDIKPYHTKILEIVEQYIFTESIDVDIKEHVDMQIAMENDPLCKGVGFGLNFDDDCGFDALDCCDLFECIGGFGLIFDNSDLLLTAPILNVNGPAAEITVQGQRLHDTYLNIKAIPSTGTIVVAGDQSDYFSRHEMFWVVRKNSLPVLSISGNTLTVAGDYAALFLSKTNFELQNSALNDGAYGVVNASHNATTNVTTVISNREFPSTVRGTLLIDTNNKNNGVYQISGYSIVGGDTHLSLEPETQARLVNESAHGAIMLRTGLIPNRKIWVENDTIDGNNGEWKITQAWLDVPTGNTVIVVDGTLTNSSGAILKLYGYETGAGSDGLNECSEPKPFNVNAAISEILQIFIDDLPAPSFTPTPTPSITPTITLTPTNTRTPTITPTVTFTPTPSVTQSALPVENNISIVAGLTHAMALLDNKKITAWGNNSSGQLNVPASFTSPPKSVSAGGSQSIALLEDGSLFSWGSNTTSSVAPAGNNYKYVTSGVINSFAITTDNALVAWNSQTGNILQKDRPELDGRIFQIRAQDSVLYLLSNGTVEIVPQPSITEPTRSILLNVPREQPYKGIDVVGVNAAALGVDGTVTIWGDNTSGQLLAPDGLNDVKQVVLGAGSMGQPDNQHQKVHVTVLKNDGTVIAWGNNEFGQTNVPVGLSNVKAIDAGYGFTIALLNDGNIISWGSGIMPPPVTPTPTPSITPTKTITPTVTPTPTPTVSHPLITYTLVEANNYSTISNDSTLRAQCIPIISGQSDGINCSGSESECVIGDCAPDTGMPFYIVPSGGNGPFTVQLSSIRRTTDTTDCLTFGYGTSDYIQTDSMGVVTAPVNTQLPNDGNGRYGPITLRADCGDSTTPNSGTISLVIYDALNYAKSVLITYTTERLYPTNPVNEIGPGYAGWDIWTHPSDADLAGIGNAYTIFVQESILSAKANTNYYMARDFNFPTTGNYTIKMYSDDDGSIYLDGELKYTQALTLSGTPGSAVINITAGTHKLIFKYLNIPDNTPGFLAFGIYDPSGNLFYASRAEGWQALTTTSGV